MVSQVGGSVCAKAWRLPSLVCLESSREGQRDGDIWRVWGRRNKAGFSKEQTWQVLEAILCLQSSEEQLESKWSTVAISRGRELCLAP